MNDLGSEIMLCYQMRMMGPKLRVIMGDILKTAYMNVCVCAQDGSRASPVVKAK